MNQPYKFESCMKPLSFLRDNPVYRQHYYEDLKFEGFPLVESVSTVIDQRIPTSTIRRISASVITDQGITTSGFSLEMRFWNAEATKRNCVDDAGFSSEDPRWGLSQAIRWAISIWEDEALFQAFDRHSLEISGLEVTLYEFRAAGAEDAEMRSRWES